MKVTVAIVAVAASLASAQAAALGQCTFGIFFYRLVFDIRVLMEC